MSLSSQSAQRLKDAGFIDPEINYWAEAKTSDGKDQPPINLDEPHWQAMMETRRKYIQSMKDEGYDFLDIIHSIEDYYARAKKNKENNPYAFVKREYYLTFERPNVTLGMANRKKAMERKAAKLAERQTNQLGRGWIK